MKNFLLKCYLKTYNILYGAMPERSKGDDLRSSVFVLVGSNPTRFIKFYYKVSNKTYFTKINDIKK